MDITQVSEHQLYRIKDVAALTTLSKSCINLWVIQGKFPKPFELSATVKVWRAKDLADWIQGQSGNVST
jgi:prophage regulatory protein